jgi:hypothetical protein
MTRATKTKVWFGLMCAVAVTISVIGCAEPRADFRGQQVTEAELAGRVQAETERLAREAADRQAAFEIAVAKMDGQRAIDIAELTANYNADRRMMEDARAALARDSEASAASIESQWTQRGEWGETIVGTVETAGELFPAIAPFAGVAAGIVGLLGWKRNASKAAAAREAVRAVAGGIASLPKEIREKAKNAIGLQADSSDRAIIAKVVADDELLKVENKIDGQ